MACCILGAFILGNLIMLWRKLKGSRASAPVSSASWRPGTNLSRGEPLVDSESSAIGRSRPYVSIVLILLIGFTAGFLTLAYAPLMQTLGSMLDIAALTTAKTIAWCRGS
jgi:hypothetical protein